MMMSPYAGRLNEAAAEALEWRPMKAPSERVDTQLDRMFLSRPAMEKHDHRAPTMLDDLSQGIESAICGE